MKKLIAYDNYIAEINGFSNMPELKKINLENNKLKEIDKNEMKNMKNIFWMNISKNKFASLDWLEQCDNCKLEILIMSDTGINSQMIIDSKKFSFSLPFEELKELNYSNNQTEELTIKSKNLTYLDCSNCSLKKL